MGDVTVTGVIASGRGKATGLLAHLSDMLTPILGARPIPGSLNVVLKSPLLLNNAETAAHHTSDKMFWTARVNGVPCLAYRWSYTNGLGF